MSKKERRPQAPKRRNFVAKHAGEFNRAETFRDRTKYDRVEDYWQDELNDYLAGDDPEEEWEGENRKKKEFRAKLAGKEFDPDMRKEYEEWLEKQGIPEDDWDDFDYDDWSGTL